MNNLMCQDTELARLNRERVKRGIGNRFYNSQREAIKHWDWGKPPPKEVIIGELPQVSLKAIRLDRD